MRERKAETPTQRSATELTQAAVKALRERLRHDEGRSRTRRLRRELETIRERCTAPSLLDEETADEILSCDEDELPH